jgi:hypothetical protein
LGKWNREGAKGAKVLFESGSEGKSSLHDSHKEPENTGGEAIADVQLLLDAAVGMPSYKR